MFCFLSDFTSRGISSTYLNSVIVSIGNDDIFVSAKAKTMRRTEVAFARSELTEFRTNLHRR